MTTWLIRKVTDSTVCKRCLFSKWCQVNRTHVGKKWILILTQKSIPGGFYLWNLKRAINSEERVSVVIGKDLWNRNQKVLPSVKKLLHWTMLPSPLLPPSLIWLLIAFQSVCFERSSNYVLGISILFCVYVTV